MTVKKIGTNRYEIRVSTRIPGVKFPISKKETFTGTKTDAESRQSELISEIRNKNSSSLTTQQHSIKHFKDIVAPYKENLRIQGQLSESHDSKIEFILNELGDVSLHEFADRFEQFIRIFRNSATIHGKLRGPASTNRLIEIVKAAFNHATKLELIEKNFITSTRFPKGEEKPRDRYLNVDEKRELLKAINSYRPYLLPITQYLLLVPCRKSELTTAKKEQFNRFSSTIYIPDSKNGTPINKPIPPEMKGYFDSIPADCPYLFFRAVKGSRHDRTGKNKRYVKLGDFKRAWSFCLKKAKLVDVRVHDLRHISATDLYEAGVPERVIMDIAGWKTQMLSQYRHKDSLKSAQKINEFFEQSQKITPLQTNHQN